MTAVMTIEFDRSRAQTYLPRRIVKQTVLIPAPDGSETIITAEWGESQRFFGPWYAVYTDGIVAYGSGRREFEETHDSTDELENGYAKRTPIEAYHYDGPTARVVTTLSSGTVETENTVTCGDWLVRWPHGEVGVMGDTKFRRLYYVSAGNLAQRLFHLFCGHPSKYVYWGTAVEGATCRCGAHWTHADMIP